MEDKHNMENQEKLIMNEQNKLIKKFASILETLNSEQINTGDFPSSIYVSKFAGMSRDSFGHILLFLLQESSDDLFLVSVLTLGKDDNDNFAIKEVAKCPFIVTQDSYIFIESLSVKKEFRNCKIGRILLQFIENYAIKHKISFLSLLPVINIAKISNKKYFDKNLYLYTTQGFVEDPERLGCLVKRNLVGVDIDYGFITPLKKLKKTNKQFQPKDITSYNQYEGSTFGATYILTDDYENHTFEPISNFTPFVLRNDEQSTIELKKFLDDIEEQLKNQQFGN